MMKQVMVRAWELAKQGAVKFGGSSKEYLASSLQIAWKEQKEMTTVIANFKKINDSLEIVIKNDEKSGLVALLNGVEFKDVATTLMTTGDWAYVINSVEAMEMAAELSGRKVPNGNKVLFTHESAKTALEQAAQNCLNAMQPSEKLTIIKHCGYGTTSFVKFEKAPKIKKIQKLVTANRKNLLEVLEKIGATIEKDTMHESYTITKSQLDDLEAALIALEKERVAKEVAAQSVEDAKRNELIAKAKETGVAQVLYSYTVECTDDKEMCDIDTVTAYIDADGIIEEIKTHNW